MLHPVSADAEFRPSFPRATVTQGGLLDSSKTELIHVIIWTSPASELIRSMDINRRHVDCMRVEATLIVLVHSGVTDEEKFGHV